MSPQVLPNIRNLIRPYWRRLRYKGSARYCPVCESHGSKFLDFGETNRADASCPFCHAIERQRLFWLYLQRETEFLSSPPEKFLHVAPEPIFEKLFRPILGTRYITSDLLADYVDVKMDITDIQYPDNSFDFIYCSHVLEHVPDDRKAMREFQRVLTKDGIAILLVPITVEKTIEDPSITDPKERLRLFGQEDHVRRYGPDYLDRLKEEGLVVDFIQSRDFLTDQEISKMGITEFAGDLYVCKKQ